MTRTTMMGRGISLGLALVASALAVAAPLAAQSVTPDARWQGWLGCWQPVSPASADSYSEWMAARARDAGLPTLCIVPSATPTSVEFVTVAGGAVTSRDTIDAATSHAARTRNHCDGWEGANWSADSRRIYLRTEYACAGGVSQTSTGMLTMSTSGQLLDIRSVASGGMKSVRIARYESVAAPAGFAVDSAAVQSSNAIPVTAARMASAGSITGADIVDASHNADSLVVEAWLVERGERFNVDAKHLIALADAGVPGRITDLIIALSYPNSFMFDRSARLASGGVTPNGSRVYVSVPRVDPFGYTSGIYGYPYGYGPLGYDPMLYGSGGRGYGYGSGYGYGYGYGGYLYQPPVVIVRGGGGTNGHGRVVNGRGYQRDPQATSPSQPSSGSTSASSGSAPASSGATSSGTSSSSSGSGETRHAKPRP
jgi:hypothetical protein